MSLSAAALARLDQHWAVSAIGDAKLQLALRLVNERLAEHAVGRQIDFSFGHSEDGDALLSRVVVAYELAAVEGLDELSRSAGGDLALREQAIAAAYRAYDIRRLLPVPADDHDRLFHVLQLSALAYCGDRWSDLRRWYEENATSLVAPSSANVKWDRRLLYRIFDCWVRLYRKKGWDDLDQIREIIAGLREDQATYESELLNSGSPFADRAIALRLAALYHWAKATEVLAEYLIQGGTPTIFGSIDKHFEAAIKAATASGDAQHEVILRWLHAAGRIMVTNSLWWATRSVNSKTPSFVRSLTQRKHQPMFELLPPQRAALLEQGLLDQAKTAIVVDLPTSGGKTLLAQFRILQALNQFSAEGGWVAYIAPTRALSAQISRRLRRDFEPIGIRVEQLTAAIEIDAFEDQLLEETQNPFQVLVATPEKLSLVIKNKRVSRPLALVVMDEAQNIETEGRGLRIELLLATIKRDCPQANFLLMMPFVDGSDAIARWLAQDVSAGRAISLGTTAWKPNERIIGLYRAVQDSSVNGGWHLNFETLTATEKAMPLHGVHRVGAVRPIPSVSKSKVLTSKGEQDGLSIQTAAMAVALSHRKSNDATSIAVTTRPDWVWSMARHAMTAVPAYEEKPDDISLVQDFLRTEISPAYELVEMLDHGIGVHHAGLSDEVRSLMEWLAEAGKLRVLCATSTIAQGINFPVSSVFLASRHVPKGRRSSVPMTPRDFWNLVGRAGRIGHDSVGVVGLAEGKDKKAIVDFVSQNTGALVSRLVVLIDQLVAEGELHELSNVLWQDQWEDFRCYVAHLWAEKKNLDAVLADSEQLLRQTFGYTTLRNNPADREKADALLTATQEYARKLASMPPGIAELADTTGFSPEGITEALKGMSNLERNLTPSDWIPESLFGEGGKMADLFGVMLKIPQLKQQLEDIGGAGSDFTHISNITRDWVNGKRVDEIARLHFTEEGQDLDTDSLTSACKAIYRAIVNSGTWGISALSQVADVDFDSLPESQRRLMNSLPAMIYHGVKTEDAVLMRMNSAPRSAAEALGAQYRSLMNNSEERFSVKMARDYLRDLGEHEWDAVRPSEAALTGAQYKKVWQILSGDG